MTAPVVLMLTSSPLGSKETLSGADTVAVASSIVNVLVGVSVRKTSLYCAVCRMAGPLCRSSGAAS